MILERLQEAVDAALGAGARSAEASHDGRALETVRFANSIVTGATLVAEAHTRLRVLVGDRMGAATTTSLEPQALRDAATRAVAVARLMPETPDVADFAGADGVPDPAPGEASEPGSWPPILETAFGIAARHGLTCAGALTSGPRDFAVVTSRGAHRHARIAEATLSVIALDGAASGYAAFCGRRLDEIDAATLAGTAAETAAAARDPVELPPGEYDVLFSPAAVVELLEWMSSTSFSARALLDGTSLLTGRAGQPICDPRITIADHWDHPAQVRPVPFDSEGVSKRRVVPIDAGRAGEAVSDLALAPRLGAPSSGHALPLGVDFADGPSCAHLVVAAGQDSTADLMNRMERGLVVTRLHYVNGLLDTRRAVMTGMTRDGTFLVEHGRRGRPVRNLRFTDSLLDAFSAERLGGLGDRLVPVATTWTTLGAVLAPALLLRRFKFTGQSR